MANNAGAVMSKDRSGTVSPFAIAHRKLNRTIAIRPPCALGCRRAVANPGAPPDEPSIRVVLTLEVWRRPSTGDGLNDTRRNPWHQPMKQ
jgi:hypothetical protein